MNDLMTEGMNLDGRDESALDIPRTRSRREAVQRPSRAQESRAAEDFHEMTDDVDWEPRGLLDDRHIPPRPGYVQRWVRTHLNGVEDPNNVGRRYNQGWRPRPADSVPEGSYVPTVMHQGSNVVGIYGMVLMERPASINAKHRAHVRAMTDAQSTAISESLFRVHEPGDGFGRPTINARSRVSRGRSAPVADD